MKFTKGVWQTREGFTINGAIDIRASDFTDTMAVFTIAPEKINHKGQTLSGPLITLEITSPREDILSISAYHYKGGVSGGPSFAIADENARIITERTGAGHTIKSGELTCVIERYPFSMSFYYEDRFLTRSDSKSLAYITTPDGAYMRERLSLSVDECIYGTGERFTNFVKNGQSIDIWNEDGGTSSELAYKNIPFVVSSKGYGVFVNHTERVSFEIASENVQKNQFSVEGERLSYYIIGGVSVKHAVINYAALTGRPSMPPAWSFGLWLSTSFLTDYDEETVTKFTDGFFERDIPLSVFHFDCFWMNEYEWCNFTWDTRLFPDPKGMLTRLKEKGLKICVWINPYIAQKSPLFDEGVKFDYLLKRPDGGVWQSDLWQPGMGIVDFTNPEACVWYCDKLSRLIDMGVDCFKTDFGERIPLDVVWHNGANPRKMHNYYSVLYNKTVFETLRKLKKTEAVVFARSASVGSQCYPIHWGGDSLATYESMAESLRGGLSLSMAGFGFWSHDIGGFEDTATPDIYKRWAAFGLLSSHSRLHGAASYRVPWLFDEEAVDVLRFFTKLKQRLLPYIYQQGMAACETGTPVMRPMVMEYPFDIVCLNLSRQYMLGGSLLIAPIFNSDGVCEFYLPRGGHTHLLTGEYETGEAFLTKTYDYYSLPLYVRDNSVIPMNKEGGVGLDIHIYNLSHNYIHHNYIYDDKWRVIISITVNRNEDIVTIDVDGICEDTDLIFHDTDKETFAINARPGINEVDVLRRQSLG